MTHDDERGPRSTKGPGPESAGTAPPKEERIDARPSLRTADAFQQEFELDHSPGRVWAALTDGRLLARWLLPCDLGADGARGVEPGASFSLTMPEGEGEEGRIDCEVVEVEPERRVAYTWRTHRDRDARPAEAVDALVTFELDPLPLGRTRLRIRQVGLAAPAHGPTARRPAAPGRRRPHVVTLGRAAPRRTGAPLPLAA